ncbi:hypothetical protein L5D93_25675 [Paenibacillus thiaminolyticus]|nr:hypothetical protein [Paenibacillus thiaminolyticus]
MSLPPDALIPIFYGAIIKLFISIRVGDLKEIHELFTGVEECCWNALIIH